MQTSDLSDEFPDHPGDLTIKELIDNFHEDDNFKITMSFPSKKDRESFRSMLYTIKGRTEKMLVSIGFFQESDIRTLSFTLSKNNPLHVLISSVPKKEAKRWSFTIIEDSEDLSDFKK